MKRQIDPGLNNKDDSDSLKEVIGTFDDSVNSKSADDIDSIVSNLVGIEDSDKKDDFSLESKSVEEIRHHHHHHHSSGEHHHHSSGEHHHHSSGEHHHHSSGEHHHHSSGEHHHSSGEHHHSSGEHHHSSGKHHSSRHHSSSSHSGSKEKKKMSVVKKVIIAIIAILLALILALVGTFFFLQSKGEKSLKTNPVVAGDYEEVIEYNGHKYKFNENIVSFAFMGIDQRDMKTSDETDFVGSADADIIVAVDTQTGKANVIAIPRDTMVEIDMYSEKGMFLKTDVAQLCLAYAYGDGQQKSCENVVKAMSRILKGVPIQKYFALNLDGIAPLNDAIGGVKLDVLNDIPEYGFKKGETVTLHKDDAEHYIRTRNMDDLESSIYRTDRQVQYVKAYANQVIPAVLKDFSVVTNLYNTATKYSRTDIDLSNVTYIASLAVSKNITTFDTYTIKGEMALSEPSKANEIVYAEFTPSEESVMETVLSVYYTQVE